MIIPIATIPINTAKSFGFTALRSIIIDGSESTVTPIINEITVPIPTPLTKNYSAICIVPNISAYIVAPITENGLFS